MPRCRSGADRSRSAAQRRTGTAPHWHSAALAQRGTGTARSRTRTLTALPSRSPSQVPIEVYAYNETWNETQLLMPASMPIECAAAGQHCVTDVERSNLRTPPPTFHRPSTDLPPTSHRPSTDLPPPSIRWHTRSPPPLRARTPAPVEAWPSTAAGTARYLGRALCRQSPPPSGPTPTRCSGASRRSNLP